jgi:FG-GAP-like repeat
MSKSSKQKSLFSFFIISLVIFTLNHNNYGQCGVYLKHSNTDLLPYSKVSIGKSEDMTGDGIPDLIASGETTGFARDRIFVFPNNGNGSFGTPAIINAPAQTPFYDNYVMGNVNNDSFKDIITVFSSSPTAILVHINNGNGTFTTLPIFNISQIGDPRFILDINNDGFGDYLGITGSSEFRYSLGNGDGTFNAPVMLIQNGIGYPGDFNNDGKLDFINGRNLYVNQGSLNFTVSDVSTFFPQNEVIGGVKDFNGDGKSDVMITNTLNMPTFSILTKTETSFIRTDYVVSNDTNWKGVAYIGNFSGNSSPDILFSPRYYSKKVVYSNDGSGNFNRSEYDQKFTGGALMNDFNNDGKTDVIQATSGSINSTLMLPDVTSITFLKNDCNRQGQTRIVDFDGSRTTDYSFWKPSTGDWSYNRSDETLPQSQTVNWGLGSLGDIPAPGDFDGDGITDRAVYRNSTGTWYIRRSSDLAWFVFKFGLTDDKPVAADFDGDTITDIAVWRPSDGNWYIWYMGTQQFAVTHFGLDGDKPVQADYDGDLKTDIAVYRPSTGIWYYLKSSDGNFAAIQWGISTDKPVPADYDGDGNADITVYRESDHFLYIIRSYNSSPAYFYFGIAQDIPQVGDYDGDFVADFAVYRPAVRRWFAPRYPSASPIFGDVNVIPTSSLLRVE